MPLVTKDRGMWITSSPQAVSCKESEPTIDGKNFDFVCLGIKCLPILKDTLQHIHSYHALTEKANVTLLIWFWEMTKLKSKREAACSGQKPESRESGEKNNKQTKSHEFSQQCLYCPVPSSLSHKLYVCLLLRIRLTHGFMLVGLSPPPDP